jgi:hypothetical protein
MMLNLSLLVGLSRQMRNDSNISFLNKFCLMIER